MSAQAWQALHAFWFLPPEDPGHLRPRREWFVKDPAFDAAIEARFGALVEEAVAGGLRDWEDEPRGALARIVLLDQFTRNIWRGTARAFAGDPDALALATRMVDAGEDAVLAAVERQFVYMPLMHAEDLGVQQRCVALFEALAACHPEHADGLDYAIRHRDIVARFGRFPHRNAQLGRATTPEEAEFLTQPGSSF